MKDTAPISQGIIAVAALFAIIAAGVAFVLYDYGLFGSAFIGGIVGVIAAIALALGWREPAPGPNQFEAPVAKAAPVAAPEPAAAAAPAPKPAAPAAAPAAEAPASTADDAPEFLSAARDGGPDDLKQIKGVGPKLEKTLHGMGIFHFDQIATWGPKEQAWIDDNLEGFKGRATRDNWVEQAKTLAAGGETEFSKKVDKGGVY
ncbi:putative flap endonuclease-1-like 5' DNA nuclease [Loktanella sp. PT4BL]|jgi:NADH-quinone oxidoreductase subunit E|uniref:NADH:ubiquinone oxidoreductase n=1 Tax=Loktanella sp. PT4BL TaxID=2135611 RepID=UPI000D769F5F|nr:NADH:ubiquinone oxidoreductase [Loktanella sp. PT4BL]PXW67727.1 putative flap endonuclease-1-like 5' DNA nuclease [Loktanella sp. PT4BL]